jgi:hypothetical protein
MKQRIISALLRIYPAAWRKEYGPEFRDLLEAIQLHTRTVADVVWNGVWQRVRATEPWVLLGLPLMLIRTIFFASMIIAPPAYSAANDIANLPGSGGVVLSLINLLLPISCGVWTIARSGGTLPHAGVQTMKMALLISAPFLVLYVLLELGLLGVVVVRPGDAPTTFAEHGFAIAFHSVDRDAREILVNFAVPMFVSTFLSLPLLWVLGALGGALGRSIKPRLRPAS